MFVQITNRNSGRGGGRDTSSPPFKIFTAQIPFITGSAYVNTLLPCAVILSTQIDGDIGLRYRAEKWAILTGEVGSENDLVSTYAFMKNVVGYDLAGFFERNSKILRSELDKVLRSLLEAK